MKKCLLILIILFGVLFSGYSQIKTTVEFVVNTDKVVYNSNYDTFINEIVSYTKYNSDNIEQILIIGSASPEGNIKRNMYLANLRANKICSYLFDYIDLDKIIINNDYKLFLEKTNLTEKDYSKLRATYIEIQLKNNKNDKEPDIICKDVDIQLDTIYIRDTVYTDKQQKRNIVFSVYNDLLSDLIKRKNIGLECYFRKSSLFIEGSFSNDDLLGKTYNIDLWHFGYRKYFNFDYNKLFAETYINGGYFDTDLLSEIGKVGIFFGGGLGVGYIFNLCSHWRLYPIIRFGLFERVYYADYYWTEQGNINISFGTYRNGKISSNEITEDSTGSSIITVNKTITKEFFENSYKAYYIGPTYVGLVLKRDFCIKHKK